MPFGFADSLIPRAWLLQPPGLVDRPIIVDGSESGGFLSRPQFTNPVRDRVRAILRVSGIDPYRPTVGGQFFDVEDGEAMCLEHPGNGHEGEVGEMLMVDSVELVPVDETHEVREFHCDHAS